MENPKLKDIPNEDLYDYFSKYLQKIIKEDLGHIYKKEAHLLDEDEPFGYQLD